MDLVRSRVYDWVQEWKLRDSDDRPEGREWLEQKLVEEDYDPQSNIRGVPLIDVLMDEWEAFAS
jgi:hypothetical protein